MITIQARSFEQLRVAVGRNLNAVELITAAANGSTTTFLTDDLFGGADNQNGKFWRGTDAPNDGVDARVVDSAVTTNRTTLTLYPAVTSTLADDTAELWTGYRPSQIHEWINQAILDATGRAFDPIENISLHGDGKQQRFDIPTGISMLSKVQYRSSVTRKVIDLAETVWTAGGSVTASLDDQDYRQGGNSVKLVLAAGVSAGDVVGYKDITSIDLSGHTHVEFWIKCTTATTAAQLKLLLDDTAAAVSPLETLSVPALVEDTWTFVRIALDNPQSDTAIISVGLEDDADIGVETVWVDDINAIREDTGSWVTVPNHLWSVDREARDLVLSTAGRDYIGAALVKLIGGDKPALLSADADVSEIDDWYIICRATELALMSQSGGTTTDPDNHHRQSQFWAARAAQAKARFPLLVDARLV